MDNIDKCIHDIAIALLPKALEECNTPIYVFNEKGDGRVNSSEILDTYVELCESLENEFKQ